MVRLFKYICIMALFLTTSIFASKSIDVDLSNQMLYAKENGKVVFSGRISSGKRGRSTPTGVFRVLEKDRFHISNKYPEPHGGAKMPYMHRLTKGGIAIHQGYLPGYPASHGCIRVSKATAKKLWRWSKTGIKVRVFGNASNFRYAKRKKSKKRFYAKKKQKNHYAKRAKKVKRYIAKKRYHKIKRKRVYAHKRSRIKHYVRRDSGYKIIEIYDSW